MTASISRLTAGRVAMLLTLIVSSAADAQNISLDAKPEGVTDGDTILIELRSKGIDAPETRQQCEDAEGSCYPCGENAEAALMDLVSYHDDRNRLRYRWLELEVWETDRLGRPVVTVYVDGKDIHLEMVRLGWAVVYHQYVPERLREAYISAENEAREAKRGMWQGPFIEPRMWRPRGGAHRLPCEG